MRMQIEDRLGVPTFLWVNQSAADLRGNGPIALGPERSEIAAARGHLATVSDLYHLSDSDVTSAVATMVHNVGRGPIIVKFQQKVRGIEIFREQINVMMIANSPSWQ